MRFFMSANMRPKNIFTALGIAIYVSGVGYCTIHAVNNNMFLLSWMLIVVIFLSCLPFILGSKVWEVLEEGFKEDNNNEAQASKKTEFHKTSMDGKLNFHKIE